MPSSTSYCRYALWPAARWFSLSNPRRSIKPRPGSRPMSLSQEIKNTIVQPGSLAIYWLCQAGFIFKDCAGRVVCIDPYFSDVVEKRFGFARMMACPMSAGDLDADLLLCTHEHL